MEKDHNGERTGWLGLVSLMAFAISQRQATPIPRAVHAPPID